MCNRWKLDEIGIHIVVKVGQSDYIAYKYLMSFMILQSIEWR